MDIEAVPNMELKINIKKITYVDREMDQKQMTPV